MFVHQIREWFKETTDRDAPKLDKFCEAFPDSDVETIEKLLNDYLWNTISIRDTAVAKERKENFHPKGVPAVYHGIKAVRITP